MLYLGRAHSFIFSVVSSWSCRWSAARAQNTDMAATAPTRTRRRPHRPRPPTRRRPRACGPWRATVTPTRSPRWRQRGHLQIRSGTRTIDPQSHRGRSGCDASWVRNASGGWLAFLRRALADGADRRAPRRGTITYVLHNAHVTVHNNTNPLVTVHFNTPVSPRASCGRTRRALHRHLRAAATPTWKGNAGKEGASCSTSTSRRARTFRTPHKRRRRRSEAACRRGRVRRVVRAGDACGGRARRRPRNGAGELDVRADESPSTRACASSSSTDTSTRTRRRFICRPTRSSCIGSSHGIIVEGDGRPHIRPCLGTPLALGFKSATVAPPGDLLSRARASRSSACPCSGFRCFGFARRLAPGSCRRTSSGAAPTDCSSAEGCTCRGRERQRRRRRLSGGGYIDGGFAARASAKTDATTTRVRFDRSRSRCVRRRR